MNKNVVILYTTVRIYGYFYISKVMHKQMEQTKTYAAKLSCRSAFHEIRGVRYHINEWGDDSNPLIVMLHGWGDCGTSFQFLVDELQQKWFVVAPDWRGFGRSRCRAGSYWFPDYIADLDELLLKYQPNDAVRLLGHSMGANVIGLYAGTMPERVAAFVNVEGFGLVDSEPDSAPGTYRRWIEQSRATPAYKTYANFEQLAQRILQRSPSMSHEKAMFVAQKWAATNDNGSVELRADPAHKLPNAVQYRRAEAIACWSRIVAPVLQVVGENTDFTAAAKAWIDPGESTYRHHSTATATIPNAGHMVHFEQPARLAAAVEAFLHEAST